MITNIDIDEDLVAEAMQVSGARTKREAVDRALRDMVARSKRTRFADMLEVLRPDDFWPDYDPKAGPGEATGKYRVEEPIARYNVRPGAVPASAARSATRSAPSRKSATAGKSATVRKSAPASAPVLSRKPRKKA